MRSPVAYRGHANLFETSVPYPTDMESSGRDLVSKMLKRDPEERITLADIRVHPWVTADGQSPLPSSEENCRGGRYGTHVLLAFSLFVLFLACDDPSLTP